MAVTIVEAVARVEAALPLIITPCIGAVGVGPPPGVEGWRQLLGSSDAIGA